MSLETPGGMIVLLVAVAVVAPLAAAAAVALGVSRASPRTPAVASLVLAFLASNGIAWIMQTRSRSVWEFGERLGGGSLIHVDGITAALLPCMTFVTLSIVLVAPRRYLDQAATVRLLANAGATFALFTTAHPAALVALWVLTALPAWIATRDTPGGRPAARVFAIAMVASLCCMAAGTLLMLLDPPWERNCGLVGNAGGWLVALALLTRDGIVPFHSWYPALFSGAPLSMAIAATVPQVGAYTAVRLLIGHADHGDGVAQELVVVSQLALVTAVYGGALAVVQRDLRGLIGTLALSQSALVLAGLSGKAPMELNGAFCVWISSSLTLAGIALVAWALESRAGPLSLQTPQGRFRDSPTLAALFLLFGLASIGLPGTLSFVADDLIVSGSLADQLHAGLMVIAATVLSGIAVVRGWFMIFGGPAAVDGPRHRILPRERVALTGLLVPLFVLGLCPEPLVASLERAAEELLGRPAEHHEETPAPERLELPGLHDPEAGS
ncbi:MAG: proton-conducting transporter membrane subunit [Planctomycetia bacterium]